MGGLGSKTRILRTLFLLESEKESVIQDFDLDRTSCFAHTVKTPLRVFKGRDRFQEDELQAVRVLRMSCVLGLESELTHASLAAYTCEAQSLSWNGVVWRNVLSPTIFQIKVPAFQRRRYYARARE